MNEPEWIRLEARRIQRQRRMDRVIDGLLWLGLLATLGAIVAGIAK